ncbi:L-fucose dehydrogenase [Algoriphagus aquimarinus]|uniref:L-fucose dehydrogenase n=1 Tax=Algoriphagus aquimarinus TaxID=237018 RepID=A0A1I1BSW5_9BACT|nr:SDR family oxidoreductase [Algoriphagus aquimarinus]SFB53519.1 L-fucose dehydrogenase [Algoriphagus aquimarinus]|tara:strand:+ start:428510 stop:429292 length:783 start_codon:yes stop_codon:yes gene_type:complete
MKLDLEQKVFIVTGGAKGIGEAITLELASEGAIPVIVGRSENAAKQLADRIEAAGGKTMVIVAELGEGDGCKSIVDQTIAAFGRLDGVINNAGANDGVSLISGGSTAFRDSLMKNLTHYYDLVHYAVPYLKETKGAIINISSKIALTGQGGTSGYAACKGAQLALTREWAVELAPFGIRVNAILPAEVMTPLYAKWLNTFEDPAAKIKAIESKIPLGQRMTTPEEIAAMTVFLLSGRSGHTTGQWLSPDGGYVHLDRAIT